MKESPDCLPNISDRLGTAVRTNSEALFGVIAPDDVPFEHDDRYYATGTEACEAGLAGVVAPSDVAKRAIDKLIRRGVGRESEGDE